MISDLGIIFSRLIGTVAVILVVAAFVRSSQLLSKLDKRGYKWLYIISVGLLGGIFGIYGNISGFTLNDAVVSVRDMGPMLAGFVSGPIAGLIAGIIAGLHRLTMGGVTMYACIVATCSIGLICGFISMKFRKFITKPYFALLVSALMEIFHLSIVLLMVRPFDTALTIVKSIAIPMIVVNALGFALMIIIMNYIEKQRNLAIERSRLKSELEVANVIQHSLLPTIDDTYPACKALDVSASMQAAKEVGGDFYDVFYVDHSRLAFVIGDVSGKGVPAALFMASAKVILQNCIRDINELPKAIEVANNALCARNKAGMFVTTWIGVLDFTTGKLEYISAGHNPAILVNNNNPEYLRVKNGFVLGGMDGMKYKENVLDLNDGDTIFLYTDGVTEAENKEHSLFGEDRLLEVFKNNRNSNPIDIINNVNNSVETFINGNSQFDDITMLCFKWNKQNKN